MTDLSNEEAWFLLMTITVYEQHCEIEDEDRVEIEKLKGKLRQLLNKKN